jgi:hypothetical protein
MLSSTILYALIGIACFTANSIPAQGILNSTLTPYLPLDPSLSASALVYTPDTSVGGFYFSVSCIIAVNTNSPVFTVGRIAGGSTAWTFDLDAPTASGNSMIYTGTTDMQAFQISDMLSDLTVFEIYAYGGDDSFLGYASGPLTVVPEPSSRFLLFSKLIFALYLKRSSSTPTNNRIGCKA